MKIKFKELINEEKPRERFIKYGSENISNEDLIAIILKTGTKDISVKELSNSILCKIKKINELNNLTINSLTSIKGIGEVKAIELLSAIELGKRVYYDTNIKNQIKIKSPNDVYKYMNNKLKNLKKEYFFVIYLNNNKNIIETKLLFIGGINSCIIDLREIFKYAYLHNAASFICIHNHPSGNVMPSNVDNFNTENIYKTGKIQGIIMDDHIIIGNNNYYSYKENSKLIY